MAPKRGYPGDQTYGSADGAFLKLAAKLPMAPDRSQEIETFLCGGLASRRHDSASVRPYQALALRRRSAVCYNGLQSVEVKGDSDCGRVPRPRRRAKGRISLRNRNTHKQQRRRRWVSENSSGSDVAEGVESPNFVHKLRAQLRSHRCGLQSRVNQTPDLLIATQEALEVATARDF